MSEPAPWSVIPFELGMLTCVVHVHVLAGSTIVSPLAALLMAVCTDPWSQTLSVVVAAPTAAPQRRDAIMMMRTEKPNVALFNPLFSFVMFSQCIDSTSQLSGRQNRPRSAFHVQSGTPGDPQTLFRTIRWRRDRLDGTVSSVRYRHCVWNPPRGDNDAHLFTSASPMRAAVPLGRREESTQL